MRVPVRLLPLAIRAVRRVRAALHRASWSLENLHDDLVGMVEPVTVDDLVRPRVCIDCGTSDDAGLCDSCAVLNTGRLPS